MISTSHYLHLPISASPVSCTFFYLHLLSSAPPIICTSHHLHLLSSAPPIIGTSHHRHLLSLFPSPSLLHLLPCDIIIPFTIILSSAGQHLIPFPSSSSSHWLACTSSHSHHLHLIGWPAPHPIPIIISLAGLHLIPFPSSSSHWLALSRASSLSASAFLLVRPLCSFCWTDFLLLIFGHSPHLELCLSVFY